MRALFALRSESMLSSTSATQTMPNPTQSRALTCSPSTTTPTSSWSTGVMNWIRPTVTSGRRRAAAAKRSSGTAVTTPAITRSEVWPVPWSRKVVSPRATRTPSTTTAIGASTAVSAVSECIASRLAPTFFLVRP